MPVTNNGLNAEDLIVSINPGHDGSVAAFRNGTLLFSLEGEHGSHPRHLAANAYLLLKAMGRLEKIPAVIATSGWGNGYPFQSASTPYEGVAEDLVKVGTAAVFGQKVIWFESSHERSHIFCSYGLSPFPQGEPCYALVWEGIIGSFYEIDENIRIVQHGPVLSSPGYKYSFLFDLADPSCDVGSWKLDTAGKLMALAGFSSREVPTPEEQAFIKRILRDVGPPFTDKSAFNDSPYRNCGVTNPAFQDLAAAFSNRLFDIFYSYAKKHLTKGYPLLIGGGCGLNCEWNSRWRDSGLFSDVFVPPVANDSGCAIGTGIEAQYKLFKRAKINWSVYSGPEFIWDSEPEGFLEDPLDYDRITGLLLRDGVVAWVHGRSEIGPRALGNRSLLASPFNRANKDRLNEIKQREWYRPIAPVCLEEDAKALFGLSDSSPFMLYFQKACPGNLEATRHVDGSARVQTVNKEQNLPLYLLLSAFKRHTGVGVLCNTSLNKKGAGFINNSRDLFAFARDKHIEAVVVNARCFFSTRGRGDADARAECSCRSSLVTPSV
jgi:predicted NodU family carbamoyl transferase